MPAQWPISPVKSKMLLEAAPDLLEALQQCWEYLDCIPESAAGGDDEAVRLAKKARARIKQATGE